MKKKIAKRIVLSALILTLLVLAACSSVPQAPDFNKLADSQDIRFVGEWKVDSSYYFVLNADGTGEHICVFSNGERSTTDVFNWRTTEKWLSLVWGREPRSQLTRLYLFSDDEQTVIFNESRQINGFNTGTGSWSKVIGEY